jgi:hypothetical protein
MTILAAFLHHLVARVPELDWLRASWLVNDALQPAGDLLNATAPALDWIDSLPIAGHVLVAPLFDIYVLVSMELSLLAVFLVAILIIGSGALHALVQSRVNSVTEFSDAIQLFARLVRGS